MFDEEHHEDPDGVRVSAVQLSLAELFFVTTLSAFAFWLYFYISPFVAGLAAGVLFFVVILRQLGRRPAVVGGIVGFFVAEILSWIVCLLAKVDLSITMLVVLIGPCAGYVVGGFMTELAEDDWP